MENYPDIEEPKKKGFTIGKLFKGMALAVIVLIYGILIVRCSMYRDDQVVSEILVNDTTRKTYHSDPNAFTVEQYGMQKAWVAVKEGRLVEFNYLYYLKAAKQLQVSVKFNRDILQDANLPTESLKFYLTDENGTVYEDYFFKDKRKFDYRYVRLCFENIDLLADNAETDKQTQNETENETEISRKSYTLHFEQPMPDGTYSEICAYTLYSGSDIAKIIPFSLK